MHRIISMGGCCTTCNLLNINRYLLSTYYGLARCSSLIISLFLKRNPLDNQGRWRTVTVRSGRDGLDRNEVGGACNHRRSIGSARGASPGQRMDSTAWPNSYGGHVSGVSTLSPRPSSGVASCPCCGSEIAGVGTVQACRRAQWANCGLPFFAAGLAGDGDGLIDSSNHDLNIAAEKVGAKVGIREGRKRLYRFATPPRSLFVGRERGQSLERWHSFGTNSVAVMIVESGKS